MKPERFLRRLAVIPDVTPSPRDRIAEHIAEEKTMMHDDRSYLVGDLDDIVAQYDKWKRLLPRVTPFYAIKCNPSAIIIDALTRLGCNFDCASKIEIQMVLSHGVCPSRIIYANATKQTSHIRYASKMGVTRMTADNSSELHKISVLCPRARILIRVAPVTKGVVQIDLSNKFGCSRVEALELMTLANSLQLKVEGISFHVGSGIRDTRSIADTVEYVAAIFDEARSRGFYLSVLDVGGGFPGHPADDDLFNRMARSLTRSLDEHFPPCRNIEIIAEPGRFFVTSAYTLYTPVVGICDSTADDKVRYVLGEGFFGCFNGIITEDSPVIPRLVKKQKSVNQRVPMHDGELKTCDLRGPTCHAHDVVLRDCLLPQMDIFDWVAFDDCGAYTTSISMAHDLPSVYWMAPESVWLLGSRHLDIEADATTSSPSLLKRRQENNNVVAVAIDA